HCVPSRIPEEFPIPSQKLITTVSRQHHGATAPRGPAHGKGRQQGRVSERLIIMSHHAVQTLHQFRSREPYLLMLSAELVSNDPRIRSFIQRPVVKTRAECVELR